MGKTSYLRIKDVDELNVVAMEEVVRNKATVMRYL